MEYHKRNRIYVRGEKDTPYSVMMKLRMQSKKRQTRWGSGFEKEHHTAEWDMWLVKLTVTTIKMATDDTWEELAVKLREVSSEIISNVVQPNQVSQKRRNTKKTYHRWWRYYSQP